MSIVIYERKVHEILNENCRQNDQKPILAAKNTELMTIKCMI